MKKYLLLIPFLSGFQTLFSQVNHPQHAAEIIQSLQKLNTLGSVLYVAAHPDDENTRLLAYLASERKVRTAYLSLTRGDGGQNLIGKEQGEPLGLIRTQELLAARRTDGAEQFFTRANDFGFSKNPEETFSIWNKEQVLSDVVLTIRRFRPDVIICRFPTTGEGGHGHHTASAILALEAFSAAADSTRFPEQLKYTKVWQARRIFWNTFNFGGTNTTAPDQLKIDVGVFNPLLGKSYGEIASESRSMHKSQGFGSARQRGAGLEYFKFLKGDDAKKDLLEGVSTDWSRVKGGGKIQKDIEKCIQAFNPQAPENSVKALVAIYNQIGQLEEKDPASAYWKQQKLKETEALILSCSGLWLEALASDYTCVPGREMNLTVQALTRNKCEVKLKSLSFMAGDSALALDLKADELYTFKHHEKLSRTAPFSNPYWLNEEHDQNAYVVNDPALIGRPENDPYVKVKFNLNIQGLDITIARDVVYKYTDPVKGEIYRPFEILPAVTLSFSEKVLIYSDASPKTIKVIARANADHVSGKLGLSGMLEGIAVDPRNSNFELKSKGDEYAIEASVTLPENVSSNKLKAFLFVDGSEATKTLRRIEYDHIPYQIILSKAQVDLVRVSLKKDGTHIGYIPGAGDDVPACLRQIGYDVTLLTDELLGKEDLAQFDAIVTGVRAYNTNDRLQAHYPKLMAYVKNGGNLIVQYNTNNRIGPVQANIGPYPFTITRDRVTDEKAEVRFIDPKHPVLNYPNAITEADFQNWTQERGIYFATEADSQYARILSMNDAGEKPMDGSLIIGKYGKGNFVYTGLVFFRELPAGVPGAYRLFANLLSLPENK